MVALTALLVPALSACGGSSKKAKLASRSSTTTTTVAGASATTVAGGPAGGSTPRGKAGSKANTATSAPATNGTTSPSVTAPTGPGPKVPVTATIDKQCVHRGTATDMQGFTAHLAARDVIGYDTVYSDNSTEASNHTYTTGYGYGKADDNGVYRATWVVPATAPPGQATLYVLYSAKQQPIALPFDCR